MGRFVTAAAFLLLAVGCVPERECDSDLDGVDSIRCGGEDCNDATYLVQPGAAEICDGLDNDCDGEIDGPESQNPPTWYQDADGDTYGNSSAVQAACDAPEGYVNNGLDCDDERTLVRPGAIETCDGRDNDCDGDIDEDDAQFAPNWYEDLDGDGYGTDAATVAQCEAPDGFADNKDDCDDSEAEVNPGAEDLCDGRDTDCDGVVEALWYADSDEDGHGDPGTIEDACEPPDGYIDSFDDCDDGEPEVYPGHEEVCGDGLDNDCDGGAIGCGLAGEVNLATDSVVIAGMSPQVDFGSALAVGQLDGAETTLVVGGPEGSSATLGAVHLFEPIPDAEASSDDARTEIGSDDWGLGGAVASGGDFNGDGFDDLLVSHHQLSPFFGVGSGSVYLFAGPVDAGSLDVDDATASGFIDDPVALYGLSVDFIPDTDGDGRDEIAIGSPRGDGSGAGRVWIFAGADDLSSLDPEDAQATLQGRADRTGWFGHSVAGLDDVDGDGRGDLVVGAPQDEFSRGRVYVFVAPFEGTLTVDDATMTVLTDSNDLYTGMQVRDAGDVDGDDRSEILVGGYRWNDTVFAYDASAALISVTDGEVDLLGADLRLLADGADQSVFTNSAPAALGDVNGDGEADFALLWSTTSSREAAVWTSPFVDGAVLYAEDADARLVGLARVLRDVLNPIVALGDLDGDGYDDFAVGNPGSTFEVSSGGAVHIVSGGPGM